MSTTALRGKPAVARPVSTIWLSSAVFLVAFVARLTPVLRGGGLRGLGNYDDGVYYSAAVALTHGRLPYRDFLFLHPPGIIVALSPFAALGRLTSQPTGMAVARLAFMVLGAICAVLVVHLLRPLGRSSALLGGLFYACYFPALYTERTTLLEGPGSLCLLVALALLASRSRSHPSARWPGRWPAMLAGLALGLGMGIKIWGVVPLVVVVVAHGLSAGRRSVLRVVTGAVVGAVAVCLPFFLAAPRTMLRLVVSDQIGRPKTQGSLAGRLGNMAGISLRMNPDARLSPWLLLVLACWVAAAVMACWIPRARAWVALLVVLSALLVTGPSYFLHYAELIAAPAALTVGAAVASLAGMAHTLATRLGSGRRWAERLDPRRREARLALTALAVVALAAFAAPGLSRSLGTRFPGASMAAAAARVDGCVTADDPSVLVQMDVLDRDLSHGCVVQVDVTGATYDEKEALHDGRAVPRADNPRWQRHLRTYLLSGAATMVVRPSADGPDEETSAALRSLPVLYQAGGFTLLGR